MQDIKLWRFFKLYADIFVDISQTLTHTRHPGTSVSSSLVNTILMFGPLGFSLAPYVLSSKSLSKWITPIANWYANASGYRKYGFKYDDLCMQSQLVQIGIFRSLFPLIAFSDWRKSRRSESMPNILYISVHKTFHLSYSEIGFEPIDPQRTIRPRVPSEAGFAS